MLDVAPSVAIHMLPTESKATLSGQEIGETWSAGKPAKYVEVFLAGSPQTMSRFQANLVEVWSPVSVISTMWPSRFSVRGLTSVAPSLPALPRSELLVQTT